MRTSPNDQDLDAGQDIDALVRRLQARFPAVDQHRVRAVVRDAVEHFRDARLRAFVATLIEKRARQTLQGSVQQPG